MHSRNSSDDGTRKTTRGPPILTFVHHVSRSAMVVIHCGQTLSRRLFTLTRRVPFIMPPKYVTPPKPSMVFLGRTGVLQQGDFRYTGERTAPEWTVELKRTLSSTHGSSRKGVDMLNRIPEPPPLCVATPCPSSAPLTGLGATVPGSRKPAPMITLPLGRPSPDHYCFMRTGKDPTLQ